MSDGRKHHRNGEALCVLGVTLLAAGLAQMASASGQSLLVQSTTSTANSGLYDHLLPMFEEKTGIDVNVVAVGTGQAIRNARNCDGDILLVHARASEEAFVASGFGTERSDLMYNDFVIVGPPEDPADLAGMQDAVGAFRRISDRAASFASRGDNSGTHKKEQTLWQEAGVDPVASSGRWYLETGSGMGATLNTAIGLGAYVLTDRATWTSFLNKQDYTILVEGDADLNNQYGVIPVNAEHCPNVNAEAAQVFTSWLLSAEGQAAIAAFRVDAQQLFFPNAPNVQ